MNTAILSLALFSLSACDIDSVTIGGVEFEAQCIDVSAGQVSLAAADVDQDGYLDLLVASQSEGKVIVFLGDGIGHFERMGEFPAGPNPNGLVTADINGDGDVDLVVANHETDYVTILLGDGHGDFHTAPNSPFVVSVRPHPHSVAIEDMDNDGRVDLVVDDRSGEGLRVFQGNGRGDFNADGTIVNVGGDPYRGFVLKDLNSDGRVDIVTPNPQVIAITMSNDSPGLSFRPPVGLDAPPPFAATVADLNGDGVLDVVSASERGGSSVVTFLGDGLGGFVEIESSRFQMSAGAKDMDAGDINGDGFDDVIVTSWASDVLVLLGGTAKLSATNLPGMATPWGVVVADVNGDAYADFVIADGVNASMRIYTSK